MPSMYYVVTAASDPEHGKYKDFGHQQNLWSSFGEQFVLHLPCAVPARLWLDAVHIPNIVHGMSGVDS